jgi:ADP-ribose pyrophosphatase
MSSPAGQLLTVDHKQELIQVNKRVKVFRVEQLFKGFFNLDRVTLRFEKFDGTMSDRVVRLNVYRSDATAVLLYDSKREKVLLVRQFRYPVYTVEPQNAWPLETVAGAVDGHSDPLETAVREVEEEAGYAIEKDELIYVGMCYPSPGGTSERIYLYAADIRDQEKSFAGGGVEKEHEDIALVELDYEEVFAKERAGEITDAKTLLLLHWLRERVV